MPRTLRLSLLFLLAAALGAPALRAQTIRWDPPGGTLPVGEVSQLQLVFDDCSPDDTPVPPKVEGLRLDYQGQSTNMSLINGTFTRNVSLTFAVLLSKQPAVDIPEFTVATNKGKLRVPPAHFAAAGATVGSTGVSLGDAATATMAASADSLWAGEVFDLKYTIDVSTGYSPSWGRGVLEWDPAPLVAEDWSQPAPYESHDNGPRTGLAYRTRALAPAAGRIRLNPTSQLVNLSVGVTGFGFFQQRQYQQFAVADSPVTLEVRPLPPAPQDFSGAVGDFKISSKVVPLRVKAGEPVTWTVDLEGSGNWPQIRGLPAREAPADFQVIQPKPKRTQAAGKLFEATLSEDVVLVPTRAGAYELPPLNFVYFDPKSGSYRTITAPGAAVTVEAAGAPAAAAPAGQEAAPGMPRISLANPSLEAKAPEPPALGLRDPVPPADSAPRPLRRRTLAMAAAVPFALLGIFWIVLAYRRSRLTDPLKPRRLARLRIEQTLEALRAAPAAQRSGLLLAWQRDSAVLLGISHAAPAASALHDAEWAALWEEADRALYSTDAVLPADWAARAQAALPRKTPRPFNASRLLLPPNLFPFFLLALALAGAARLGAADAVGSYRRGDFAAAENAWGAEVAADPLNWAARHNLSLALAQQDRWGEAAAQAAAAFVQNPADPAARWQMAVACDKAGFVPEPLDVLMQPGPLQSLARLESPGGWQRTGAEAAALAALGLGLLLAAAYGIAGRRWASAAGLTLVVLALVLGSAAFVAYRAYGITADTRAVVVWRAGILRSIPTETDVSQKTTALPAGSTAVVNGSFLRWIRLSFPNGQTGWAPRTEVVSLWRSDPK